MINTISPEQKTQTQPQYTDIEKKFLRNIHLASVVSGKDLSNGAAREYENEYLFGLITTKQSWTGIIFTPGSEYQELWRNETTKSQLLDAFGKFSGVKYESGANSFNYNTTCGVPTDVFFNVEGDVKALESGLKKMVKTANDFVRAEMSTQESKVLQYVINKFKESECGCSSEKNIDDKEGASIEKLHVALTSNKVRGGQTLSAVDITNLSRTTGIDSKILTEAARIGSK